MSEFKVIEIIDAKTIKTQPMWSWSNRDGEWLTGFLVQVSGYNVEGNDIYAKQKLESILNGQYVVLKNPKEISGLKDKIECTVTLNDVDISNYFPEYKNNAV